MAYHPRPPAPVGALVQSQAGWLPGVFVFQRNVARATGWLVDTGCPSVARGAAREDAAALAAVAPAVVLDLFTLLSALITHTPTRSKSR